MATQKNSYGSGNTDLTNLFETVDMQRKGHINIEIDEANKQIEQGSTVEVNGSIFFTASDENITDNGESWASIGSSTVFYVYFVGGGTDEFQYSTDAPTFSSQLGGWYDGNDRAVCKAFKDSGDNFTAVQFYPSDMVNGGMILRTDSDDTNIQFAGDANILWDESQDELILDKGLIQYHAASASHDVTTPSGPSQDQVFDLLSPFIPNVGSTRGCTGLWNDSSSNQFITHFIHRQTSTAIVTISTESDGVTGKIDAIRYHTYNDGGGATSIIGVYNLWIL